MFVGAFACLASYQQQLTRSTRLAAGAWSPGMPGIWEDQAFETHMEFRMPFMDFVEDIYVHSDKPHGLMRLSYYSGSNIFLVNETGLSFELLPIVDTLNCLYTPSVSGMEIVVPEMKTFLESGSWREVDLIDDNGLYSIGFEFTLHTGAPTQHQGNETWTYYDTESKAKLAGTYKFIVNATAGGFPLNLTFKGHNGFLVSSHYDEYEIVYKAFYHRFEGIDETVFRPPRGMPCKNFDNIHGPFMKNAGPSAMHQSRPLAAMRDLAMALPGANGVSHQQQVAKELEKHLEKHAEAGDSQLKVRRDLAMTHYRWIQARNRRGAPYKLAVNHMVTWLPHEKLKLCGRMKDENRAVHPAGKSTFLVATQVLDKCGDITGNYEVNPETHRIERKGVDFKHLDQKHLKDFHTEAKQTPLPEDLDLHDKGQVAPVKDQGTCGSCWSFGAIGALEGQYAKHTGTFRALAEQQLVDCSWTANNMGCDGGNDYKAFSWLMQENKGKFQPTSKYGPYLSQDGFCHLHWPDTGIIAQMGDSAGLYSSKQLFDTSLSLVGCSHVRVNFQQHPGYSSPTPASVEEAQIDMLALVLNHYGPASISVTASDADFYYYSSGVYNDPGCSTTDLDHIVVLTGYGVDKNIDTPIGLSYWTIKNSWSTHWGENGNMRIARKGNVCGVMSEPVLAHLG